MGTGMPACPILAKATCGSITGLLKQKVNKPAESFASVVLFIGKLYCEGKVPLENKDVVVNKPPLGFVSDILKLEDTEPEPEVALTVDHVTQSNFVVSQYGFIGPVNDIFNPGGITILVL